MLSCFLFPDYLFPVYLFKLFDQGGHLARFGKASHPVPGEYQLAIALHIKHAAAATDQFRCAASGLVDLGRHTVSLRPVVSGCTVMYSEFHDMLTSGGTFPVWRLQ